MKIIIIKKYKNYHYLVVIKNDALAILTKSICEVLNIEPDLYQHHLSYIQHFTDAGITKFKNYQNAHLFKEKLEAIAILEKLT
jgi:hypothetical protein